MLSRLSTFSGPLSSIFASSPLLSASSLILSLDAATYSGSGPWIDVIGGKSFTLYNSPTYVNTDEKYFYFSSNNTQYAQATSLASLPVFTIEIWHRWDGTNTGSNPCLISEVFTGGPINYFLGAPGGSVADGGYYNNSGFQLSPQFGLTASNWYQIVMSCDSSQNIRIYINGTLISTTPTTGNPPSTSNSGMRLMRRWDNPDCWGGSLGLVNIYNTALSPTKIEESWNINKARFGFTASGFTTNGLILKYEISDTNSYSVTTTVTDLKSNSNATLYNGPVYSLNGYINFDGSNDYLSTNTSLNSKLLPVNTSTFISHFVWVYPTDNGVIVSEIGQTTPNTLWHDSQIEIVSGNLKFGLWTISGLSSLNSTISTPLYNWYYVGLTYDGTTMRGYVNGELAGTKTLSRLTPYNGSSVGLHFAIAASDSTSLGDGSPAKMKLGAFHVYNSTLTQQQVLNNYNYSKNNYIYTGSMSIWIDANDSFSFNGGSISDLSGNGWTHSLASSATSSNIFGFKSFNCTSSLNNYIQVNGTGPLLSTSGYTYVAWARITSDSSTYRTLYRSAPNDHALLVDVGTDNLGFWDNDSNSFKDSGYDVTSIEDTWVQYSVVGDSSSSIFYINDVQVGSVSFGSGGNRHNYFGAINGQPFGYVGNMMLYNKKLTLEQITQNYDALKNVYKNGDFVTTNLKLYFNPDSYLSYPSSGTTVTDLTGNSLNGTLTNVTFNKPYFTFNGSSSQITINDNSLLEPGSGDWTMEVWIKPTSLSSPGQVVLGKFDPGGLSADISYAIRISNSNVRADFSNGSSAVVTSNYTLSLNNWTHLTYVFNNVSNNDIITYINGASYSATTHNFTSILNTSANLYLGSYNGGEYSQYFNGQMGIVRIYSSALSASDISKNFEANRNIYGI